MNKNLLFLAAFAVFPLFSMDDLPEGVTPRSKKRQEALEQKEKNKKQKKNTLGDLFKSLPQPELSEKELKLKERFDEQRKKEALNKKIEQQGYNENQTYVAINKENDFNAAAFNNYRLRGGKDNYQIWLLKNKGEKAAFEDYQAHGGDMFIEEWKKRINVFKSSLKNK